MTNTARDSLAPLFSDTVSVQDSVFGKLDIQPAETGGLEGKPEQKLEFPLNLGTNDINHFVVFHIYGDLMANLETEQEGLVEDASEQTNQYATNGAIIAGSSVLTTRTVPRFLQWITTVGKGGGGGRVMALKGIASLIGAGLAAWGGWEIGELAGEASLSTEEKDALISFQKWTEKTQEMTANEVLENTQGRLIRFGKARARTKDTVALYMPQKIQSLSVLEYEQQDLSFAQNVFNDLQGQIAKLGITKLTGALDTVGTVVGGGLNTEAALLAELRMVPNPRKQLMFREPISRKFELNFNFSPRNEMESVRAYQIIQTFKKHAYPKLNRTVGKGTFYTFPAEFEIEYYTMINGEPVQNDWLNKIGRCALREINVDYASSGSFSTFANGAPTNMIMSLTFEEMALLDSELIEQGY